MNAKEYLGQAYRIDLRIHSKQEQIKSLNDLAMRATNVISDMPGSATRNVHKMEDVVVKIVDLQEEIKCDISKLVDLKSDIMAVIKEVDSPEQQTLLELRYLCFKSWEEIAVAMGYTVRNIYFLHRQALKNVTFH